MKKIKSFLMVLSIIGLFIFASCKNNFTPEQVKVVCNVVEKIKIKGVAKIGDAFVPHGTKIRLFIHGVDYFEDMMVSDDEGHFESKNQFDIDTTGKMYFLEIEKDGKVFSATVTDSSAEDAVYNFELTKTTIKGVAKIDDAFVPKDTIIQLFVNGTKVEDIAVSDDEGHFESKNQYYSNKNQYYGNTYILEIKDRHLTAGTIVINLLEEDVVYNFTLIKTTIKGIAKIGDAFVPAGTIIQLFANGTKVEDITVSDDEGHFESTNQFNVDTTGEVFVLKIENNGKIFRAKVSDSSAKDAVYEFNHIPPNSIF